jgi:L-iditol 2-dehydrogenase
MKAAYFRGTGQFAVEERPDPVPGDGEVLLEPLVVGICGTDSHIIAGHYASRPPVVLGHEIAARVLEVRGDAPTRVGDLVTVDPHRYCGVCQYCRLGMEHMCLRKEAYGVHLDGGMAQLLVVPARTLFPVAPAVTPSLAAMAEPLACCVHGIDRLAPVSGLPLVIFGAGAAGAMLIALARHHGAYPIVSVDPNPDKRDLAIRMGADIAIDPADEGDITARLLASVDTDGYPFLIDAVGSADVLAACMRLAGRGARILVFGVAEPGVTAAVAPNEVYAKELTILGSAINPYTHGRAAALLNRLPLDQMRVRSVDLDDAAEAIAVARSGRFDKVQVRVNR